MLKKIMVALMVAFFSSGCFASLIVKMARADAYGEGANLGTIRLDDTIYGLMVTPKLHGLPTGAHGFAVYTVASCDNYANAAAGHYDPLRSFQHHGPYHGDGHLGDLPLLIVGVDGRASVPVLAPRLKLTDVKNRSLVIIAGSDNYSDEVMKVNNSKRRIACGVIPYF